MENDIEIMKTDITDLSVDAIVNAANRNLSAGGGVCGAIFRKADFDELENACSKIGRCETGSAVITPGFNLKAKYIIHAVGPVWNGGCDGEEELLYSAYSESLKLAWENGLSSIAFPVISSGIYGYPKREAWKIAIRACMDFCENHNMKIIIAVLSEESRKLGENILNNP